MTGGILTDCGGVLVDRAIPFKERNPLAVTGFFRGEDKKPTLPVS